MGQKGSKKKASPRPSDQAQSPEQVSQPTTETKPIEESKIFSFNMKTGDIIFVPELQILMRAEGGGHDICEDGSDPCFADVLIRPCTENDIPNPLTLERTDKRVAIHMVWQSVNGLWTEVHVPAEAKSSWAELVGPLETLCTSMGWDGEEFNLQIRKMIENSNG